MNQTTYWSLFLLSALILFSILFCTKKQNEWIVLFDGSSTNAWRGYQREDFPSGGWRIENGALKTIVGGDQCDIITKEKYQDFELELEWKTSPGGNSGIFYRATENYPAIWQSAPEMQVLDDSLHHNGLDPRTSAGALYALIAPKNKILRPVGEFNSVRIVVMGHHVEHWLNGTKILEYELGSDELKSLVAESKFKEYPSFADAKEGYIGLQHHGQEVWFRNIKIKPLN